MAKKFEIRNSAAEWGCVIMEIYYQKAMSKGTKWRISCASACVFEILHYVPLDDKMKANFYFDTASDGIQVLYKDWRTAHLSEKIILSICWLKFVYYARLQIQRNKALISTQYKRLNEEKSEARQAIYWGGKEPFSDEGVFITLRRYLHRFTKASS